MGVMLIVGMFHVAHCLGNSILFQEPKRLIHVYLFISIYDKWPLG